MRKTVLLFGISSFVGSNLFEELKNDFRIIGTYHDTPVRIPGVLTIKCDVLKKDFVNSLFAIFRPDVVIYAVGEKNILTCHHDKAHADALNTAGAINVCSSSDRFGAKFVYLSSSLVHSGENNAFKESETPFPCTVYGHSVSAAEFYIQRSCLNFIILRCSLLYGRSYNPKRPNRFELIEDRLTRDETFIADSHISFGFIDVAMLGKILRIIIREDISNRLFQISSQDVMTYYDFALSYAKIFKKEASHIVRGQWEFPVGGSSHSGQQLDDYFFKMDCTNIEGALNITLPSVEESLEETARRLAT